MGRDATRAAREKRLLAPFSADTAPLSTRHQMTFSTGQGFIEKLHAESERRPNRAPRNWPAVGLKTSQGWTPARRLIPFAQIETGEFSRVSRKFPENRRTPLEESERRHEERGEKMFVRKK